MADHTPDALSPLARWGERLADISVHSGSALTLREEPFLTHLNVRSAAGPGRPPGHDHPAVHDLPPANDLPSANDLPAVNEVAEWTGGHLLGLGPDEWLAVGAPGTAGELTAEVRTRLGASLGALVDVSAQRTTIVATGPAVRDLLRHGCALDMTPAAFGVGRCAQTMLAHAQVILWHTAADEFRILVRPSFAGYLAAWLLDAAVPYLTAASPA